MEQLAERFRSTWKPTSRKSAGRQPRGLETTAGRTGSGRVTLGVALIAVATFLLATGTADAARSRGVAPTNTSAPAVSGAEAVGAGLSATVGSWTGTSPIRYAYQWQRCDLAGTSCVGIRRATRSTYTVTSADNGKSLRVLVTASNRAGRASAGSAPKPIGGQAPASTALPAVSGTVQEGATLTLTTGSWTGTQPITLAQRWERCDATGGGCGPIAGATSSMYLLSSADVGATVRAVVTASNAFGTASVSSSTTGVVLAPEVPEQEQSPDVPANPSTPRFGISTGYKLLTRSAAERDFELDQIQSIGAKIVRFDSLPGNQAALDPVVAGVLARGMEPLLVLFGTTPPISPSEAAAFAASQAAKWKGQVRLYEFANEPDLHGWTGTTYAESLIAAYDAIKAVDPNATVIGGALWKGAGGPVQFVSDMYAAGAKGHFDILSLHLYDDPFAAGDWNIWNMAFHSTTSVRSVMDANGDQAIPIASTETGGPVTTYGEEGQASIIGHDFDALAADPRLAFVLVYSMMDDDVPGFGLLRPDGSQRPAWAVFKSRAGA